MDSRCKEMSDEIIPMESEGEEAAATKIQSVKKGDPDSGVAPKGEEDKDVAKSFESFKKDGPDNAVAPKGEEDATERKIQSAKKDDPDSAVAPKGGEDVAKSFESVKKEGHDSAVAPKKEEDTTRGIQSDKTEDSDSVVAPKGGEDRAKSFKSAKQDSPDGAVGSEEQEDAAKRIIQSATTEDPVTLPKRKQGSWCWLLAPDGTPSTIDLYAKKERTQDQNSDVPPNTKPKEPKKQGSWCWLLAPDGSPAIVEPEAETATGSHASGPNRNPVRTNWHWLLAPDGSPATADLTMKGKERKAQSSQIRKKRDRKQASWNWLLAPDGTPAMASNSTTLRKSRTGKRIREDLSDDEEFVSRPRRSCSHHSKFYYDYSTEDEDANSECSDFDERNIDGDLYSVYSSEESRMRWERNFQLLVEYKTKYKTTNVPNNQLVLGRWVRQQRILYKRKRLKKYRRQRLESLQFQFDPLMEQWMNMYNRLLLYKKQHGGATNMPQGFKDQKLARWVYTQRRFRKTLSKEKIDLLESIGFQWKMKERHPAQSAADRSAWMEMYQRLLAYKQKYNNTRVPRLFKEDQKLGNWVNLQRWCCTDEERVDLLNYIGFEWDSNESGWMEMFRRLCAYREQYKTTRVPKWFKGDAKLGLWVSTQRHDCSKKNRVDLLNSIGFEWNPLDAIWMEMYQRLLAYQKQHKSTRVPQSFEEDPKLGKWVSNQRSRCTRKDRVDLLNAIGFEWNCAIY